MKKIIKIFIFLFLIMISYNVYAIDKIESCAYLIKNTDYGKIIIGAEEGTLISDFINNLDTELEYVEVFDKNNIKLNYSETDTIKTGMIIKYIKDENILDELKVIVRGDINEDGLINVSDSTILQDHILKKEEIEDYRLYAMDIDIDENTEIRDSISISDNVILSDYILRKSGVKLNNDKFECGIYSISYDDSIKDYSVSGNAVSAKKGTNITVNLTDADPKRTVAIINGRQVTKGRSYTYDNGEVSTFTLEDGIATVSNVRTDITFAIVDSVEIFLGSNNAYFKSDAYRTVIENIKFVDYINLDNADNFWDITVDQNGLAYSWVEGNTVYIGSELILTATDLSNAFYGMKVVTELDFNGRLDTSNTTNMKYTFSNLNKITNLDLRDFDTSNVTNMQGMFTSCGRLEKLNISSFDTSKVETMSGMFFGLTVIKELDVSKFITNKVTDMSKMFYGCLNLLNVDVSNFDTSNVTNMSYMFYDNNKLPSINVTNFNTSKVTNLSSMFYSCKALTSLDLHNFNTTNVVQMTNMFYNCNKLTSLDVSSFETPKAVSFDGMFNSCSSLTSINVSGMTTVKASSFSNMFRGCKSLTTLDLSSFNTSTVKIMDNMFYGDTNLKTIYVSDKWSTSNVLADKGNNLFYDCTSLSGAINYDETKVSSDYANTNYYMTLKQ